MQEIEELNQAQQELIDSLGKTYKDTNITAPTVAGWGRIKKLYGNTVEEGTGDKSPDNPYTLKCVGDDVNLFDETQLDYSIAVDTVKYINLTLEPNTEYTLSTTLPLTRANVAEVFLIRGHSTSGTTNDNGASIGKPRTITSDANGYLTVSYRKLSGSTWNLKDHKFKLHKGSVTTPYSPYGYGTIQNISTDETNTSSNVAYVDKPLCSVGDVRDEIDYTNGKITRRCGYVVLNGRENVSGQNGQYYVLVNCAYGVINAICSHYTKTKDWDEHGSSGDNFIVYRHEGWAQGRISFKDTTFSNVTEFKTYLAEQYAKGTPVTVIYELPTPTIEDIDCSDKIVQYGDSTNVYNRDGAEIEVSLTNNETVSGLNEVDKVLEQKIAKQEAMSTYSTEEQVVGKWIDGKPLYRKVVNFGTLPNNTLKSIGTGLVADQQTIVNINGVFNAKISGVERTYSLNSARISSLRTTYGGKYIEIETISDLSEYSAYVVLEYTKTTD